MNWKLVFLGGRETPVHVVMQSFVVGGHGEAGIRWSGSSRISRCFEPMPRLRRPGAAGPKPAASMRLFASSSDPYPYNW